ncbi:MAG TPA: choice-of-anchor D domain-containing protein [Solirubrobacter sp.]|nr:choice-of-anchor D domain-containing protein [Solirubrobacter sp.]
MRAKGFIAIVVGVALAPLAQAQAATTQTVTFVATGAEQTFTVPPGVTSLHVVAVGARGGDAFDPGDLGGDGGLGARVEGDVGVTPGRTLYVEVGTTPAPPAFNTASPGGFNGGGSGLVGGGGGGGASDVRTLPAAAPASPGSRLVVAAGGGGGGEYGFQIGLAGGDGGAAGVGGGTGDSFGASVVGGTGGAPGGASAGGTGGSGGAGAGGPGGDGTDGARGVGGNGGGTSQNSAIGGGGGGGGGVYGGGGGGGGGCCQTAGGGGGGGSSAVLAGTGAVTPDTTGVAQVAITYGVPTAEIAPAALAFPGVVPLGTVSAPLAVDIANRGSAPLLVSGLSFDGDEFLIGSSTCGGPVAPGSSCRVTVRFAPAAGGARAARLLVASNAPAASVALTGTGGTLPADVPGPTGPAGPPGPAGAPGPAGERGAPGAVELVTCRTRKVRKHTKTTCTGGLTYGLVRFTFGARAKVTRATLRRGRVVYARGTAVRRGARTRLLLKPTREIRPGRYTLRLKHRRMKVVIR